MPSAERRRKKRAAIARLTAGSDIIVESKASAKVDTEIAPVISAPTAARSEGDVHGLEIWRGDTLKDTQIQDYYIGEEFQAVATQTEVEPESTDQHLAALLQRVQMLEDTLTSEDTDDDDDEIAALMNDNPDLTKDQIL